MMLPRIVPVSPTTMPALRSMVTRMLLPAVLPVLVIPPVPKMLTGVPDGKVNLGASLRAPLARRLTALTAVAGPTPSSSSSTASVARPPYAPRDGAARPARRSARLARSGRLRASPRTVAAALRASPVPASPRTALRTTPCSRVRTSADTSARASGSVLRTTACGSGRTAARSRAAAAPLSRVPRRRFPKPRCCRFGRPDRRGGLGSHTGTQRAARRGIRAHTLPSPAHSTTYVLRRVADRAYALRLPEIVVLPRGPSGACPSKAPIGGAWLQIV